MQIIKLPAGEYIDEAAQRLIEASASGEPASCSFNGITLTTLEGDTAESIVERFLAESKRRTQAYRNSPEGKRAERRRKIEVENLQARADKLMARLPNIFTGSNVLSILDNILGWLCEMEEPRDHVEVKVDTALLISTFAAHGYIPNANCDEQFNESDPDNYARWIIGQALQEPYHPLVGHFAKQWRQRFATHSA